ncbi:MAG: hypothetical protein ABIT37_17505 [Luteolibacter sp.]
MKAIALSLLLALSEFCFATDDVMAVGEWSAPVRSSGSGPGSSGTIRGRLMLAESPRPTTNKNWRDVAVYLELQECDEARGRTLEVYCNLGPTVTLSGHLDAQGKDRVVKAAAIWEMQDASGKLVPKSPGAYGGGAPGASWVTLPSDSTVRLRASVYGGGKSKDGSLTIFFLSNCWVIPPHSTNDYYLSCTFTVDPPSNHVTQPDHKVWQGTLNLPKLKIPVQGP